MQSVVPAARDVNETKTADVLRRAGVRGAGVRRRAALTLRRLFLDTSGNAVTETSRRPSAENHSRAEAGKTGCRGTRSSMRHPEAPRERANEARAAGPGERAPCESRWNRGKPRAAFRPWMRGRAAPRIRTKQPHGALSFGGVRWKKHEKARAPGDPALLRPRDGGGGAPGVPAGEAGDRPRDRRRLLLRFRPAPRRGDGGSRRHRGEDARHRGRRHRFTKAVVDRAEAAPYLQGPALQAGAYRGASRGGGDLHLHAGHLH